MEKIVDVFIRDLPLLNIASSGRACRFSEGKEKKKWQQLIQYHTKKPRTPHDVADVFLRRCTTQEPDYDNLVISFKYVIDAIVQRGILENDRPKNFRYGHPEYKWIKSSKANQGVNIEIWA